MKNNKTFLFIHKHMGIGGIETYLYRTIKYFKKNGNRIIWIFPEGGYIDDGFRNELLDGSVEIINVNFDKISWINDLDIKLENNEEIFALAFNLFNFVFLEMIKKKYKNTRIDSFFWVPHFEEKGVFLEQFAPKSLQPVFRRYFAKIIYRMELNNNIIYVNRSHLKALTSTYGYKVENKRDKLLTASTRVILPYDYDLALKQSKRKEFNIITVGRFSFPHKIYLIGLIRSYGKLKEKYDQIKLTIIGYGPDKDRVLSEIDKLSYKAKKDLHLVGKVAYDDLRNYFENAHLNIGVAGTIVEGALTGLISIPVRHYSESCEGYGYLPDSREYTACNKPGKPIEEFIEEVINMDESEYLKLSRMSYDTYATQNGDKVTNDLLSKTNNNPHKILDYKYILSIRVSFKIAKLIHDRKKYIRKS